METLSWKEFSLVVLQTILNGSPLELYFMESTAYTRYYMRRFYKFGFLAIPMYPCSS